VDTGADVSVLPKSTAKKRPTRSKYKIYAANGSAIPTYGEIRLRLNLKLRRDFDWQFIIAEVQQPILGADFLKHFKLLVDLDSRRLIDSETELYVRGVITTCDTLSLTKISHDNCFKGILQEFDEVTRPIRSLESKHGVQHQIITSGHPIAERARRLSPNRYKAARAEFQSLIQQGICEPSSSPWASPLHMVRKADGTWRPCGNYRRLNKVTTPDRYPVPHLHDFTHRLHGCKIFTTLDLNKAFHQIPVVPEDRPKTAVITPFGLFQFNRMTFGLCNAAQTFQRLMDIVLRGIEYAFCYIDDILIASTTPEQHAIHVREILSRLQQHGLSINVEKCTFGAEKVRYLGHTINKDGIAPLQDRIAAIKNYPKPNTVKELRRFLGFIIFYRRMLKGAALYQASLHKLASVTGKEDKRKISWTPETQEAFEQCKKQLEEATLLAHPKEGAPLILQTYASDTAIGAALQQFQGDKYVPLSFFSQKLTETQKNYL